MVTENILFKYVHSSPQSPYTHIYTSYNVAISVRFTWQENSPDKKVKSKAIPLTLIYHPAIKVVLPIT